MRLRTSDPWPATSSAFDGRTILLRGARGETLGLQVRLAQGARASAELRLPGSAARVTAFSVGSLEVSDPSSDLYGPSRGRGWYPDILFPQPGEASRGSEVAYFDVEIHSDAAPGRYEGELITDQQRTPVVLGVSRARINLDPDPLVWAFYLPGEIARAHGHDDDDGRASIEAEQAYYDLFRAHGVLLAADLPPARFASRRAFVRDVQFWPVGIDISSDQAIATDVQRWLDVFQSVSATPFAIPVDEPRTLDERVRARHVAEVIGRSGGGRPRLLRGVTDGVSAVYGDAIDVFISPRNVPTIALQRRARGERFWTYNGRPPAAGSMTLDADGSALRTWGWIAYRYGVELWYAWEALYFSDRYNNGGPTDVMRNPVTFDERRRGKGDWGNGDGVLAYPGPLPSLRLKTLRRGLEDRLLLRELEACGRADVADRIARRIVPHALAEADATASWPEQESTWERARYELLDAIEATCDDARLER